VKKPKLTPYNDYAMWVTFDIFSNYRVRLVISDDLVKSGKARLNSAPDAGGDGFVFNVTGEGRSYLFLTSNSVEGTVAHECWHVVRRMFDWIGADLDNELVAYHLGYMVDKVYEFKRAIAQGGEHVPSVKVG
jgi:hypothetical protein